MMPRGAARRDFGPAPHATSHAPRDTPDARRDRTADGQEIDLILEGARRWAIDVKLTSAPHPEDLVRLGRVANLVGADVRVLVSRTPHTRGKLPVVSTNLPGLLALLGVRRPNSR